MFGHLALAQSLAIARVEENRNYVACGDTDTGCTGQIRPYCVVVLFASIYRRISGCVRASQPESWQPPTKPQLGWWRESKPMQSSACNLQSRMRPKEAAGEHQSWQSSTVIAPSSNDGLVSCVTWERTWFGTPEYGRLHGRHSSNPVIAATTRPTRLRPPRWWASCGAGCCIATLIHPQRRLQPSHRVSCAQRASRGLSTVPWPSERLS